MQFCSVVLLPASATFPASLALFPSFVDHLLIIVHTVTHLIVFLLYFRFLIAEQNTSPYAFEARIPATLFSKYKSSLFAMVYGFIEIVAKQSELIVKPLSFFVNNEL